MSSHIELDPIEGAVLVGRHPAPSGDPTDTADGRSVGSTAEIHLGVRAAHAGDARALEALFAGLDTTWFRPHELDAEGARTIAHHVGKDVYLIGFLDRVPVAYGMLRGWDEGYEVPSLGIAVRDGHRDQGLGRQMMHALHQVVRERGCDRVRLRVAPGNRRARHLYASLGYRQVGIERGELLLMLELDGVLPERDPAG